MFPIKSIFAGLSAVLVLAVTPAQAALTDIDPPAYGVYAGVSTASRCPSFCQGSFAFDTDGGELATSASASDSTYGIARASASFAAGASYLPQLRAFASSDLLRGATSTAFASQLFGYNGADNHAVSLDVMLTGSVSNGASGYVSNFIDADVAVVINRTGSWSPDFGSMVFEAFGDVPETDILRLEINGSGVASASGVLDFSLNDGDFFYVITELTAVSRNGVANAENTLNLGFGGVNGDNGIVAVTAAVPEPETWAMLLAGLGLLGLRARRRQA